MALIKCKECNKKISDKATTCIHCGCPIENNLKQDIKNDNKREKKKISFTRIIRYMLSILLIAFSFFSVKGLGTILMLITTILVLPISADKVYEKIKLPKILKVLLPIILFIISMSFFNLGSVNNSTPTTENIKVFCSVSKSSGQQKYSITLTGNNKKTTIKGYETFSSSIIGSNMCKQQTTIVNGYHGGSISCSESSNRYTISYTYQRNADINKIVKEYQNDGYTCK